MEWNIIDAYTRRQAIEDGVLVDLMQDQTRSAVLEAGFKFPVAMTTTAFEKAVWPIDDGSDAFKQADAWLKGRCQDFQGRLWDVLWMLRMAIKSGSGDRLLYRLIVQDWQTKRRRTITLKSVVGPGDDGEPVITIMLPEED